MINIRAYKAEIISFFITMAAFILLSLVVRFFANTSKFVITHYGIIIKSAICFAFTLQLWKHDKKVLKVSLIILLLYILSACLKVFAGMPLDGQEVSDAYCFASLMCAAIFLLLRLVASVRNSFARKIGYLLTDVFVFAVLIPPIMYIGYFLLNGQILLPSIVLTLFQTNLSETVAYLKSRNTFLWCIGILFSVAFITGVVKFFNGIAIRTSEEDKKGTLGRKCAICVFSVILSILGYKGCSDIVDNVQAITVFKQTQGVLKQYRDYSKAKQTRMKNLEQLKGLGIKPEKGGLYVLVIGESETRDHMNAYGYKKENTPWLSTVSKQKETVLFQNAYSNHTHTVPVLTYALSGKNQYNKIKLSKAYSIMEVAKAAGYKTVWISNQIKYSAWDTPTAEMASTADYEIWLNGNVGKSNDTQYYDGEIVRRLSELKELNNENVFIVCHLMGCHGYYKDRYPEDFEKFKVKTGASDSEKNVSTYDNCVFYNDYVLEQIFKTASKNENFKAMIYLSDHGEEPDLMKNHEVSMFTWQMARIPFVMFFSNSFIRDSNEVFQTLTAHKDKYWTNDLLYNVLIEIMAIQNAPDCVDSMNIASGKYNMDKFKLKTLHGKKSLADDIHK